MSLIRLFRSSSTVNKQITCTLTQYRCMAHKSNNSSVKDTVESNSQQPNESEYGLADKQQIQATDRGVKSGTPTQQKQHSNVDKTSSKVARSKNVSGNAGDNTWEGTQKKAAEKHKNVRSKSAHPILSKQPPSGSVDYSY